MTDPRERINILLKRIESNPVLKSALEKARQPKVEVITDKNRLEVLKSRFETSPASRFVQPVNQQRIIEQNVMQPRAAVIPVADSDKLDVLAARFETSPVSHFVESREVSSFPKVNVPYNPKRVESVKGEYIGSISVPIHQFKYDYPDVNVPGSSYGDYDVVTVTKERSKDDPNVLEEKYVFSYSPEAKHKIKIAGSVDNYDVYLKMARSHPELIGPYILHGGEGVGPWNIIPTFGFEMWAKSGKPGITGANEREEAMVRYLYETRGNYYEKPSLGKLGRYIATDVPVQLAVTSGIAKGVAAVTKAGTRVAVRSAPKIIAKLPGPAKKLIPKAISATSKLGGPSEKTVLQTTVGRNFMRWATEGAVPVVETTSRVVASKHTVRSLFSGTKATSYIDDLGNVVLKSTNTPIGYVDDFNRVILFKPKRTFGFLERKFVSPEIAKRYAELLKKGVTKPEINTILRGEVGENHWITLQQIAEQSGYKKRFLRGVEYPYKSKSIELTVEEYPRYLPKDAFLTESEAFRQAVLKGRVPGEYGSLYNVQSDVLRELGASPELAKGVPAEFLASRTLPGKLTVAAKKVLPTKMKNIWVGKKFNPFTKEFDEAAIASLIGQPSRRIISLEEREIVRQLSKGGSIFGKGVSYGNIPSFLIPEERLGYEATIGFFGFRPLSSMEESKIKKVIQERKEVYGSRRPQVLFPESRSEFEDIIMFSNFVDNYQRAAQRNIQIQKQQQRREEALVSRLTFPFEAPPRLKRDTRQKPPTSPPIPPSSPPVLWFPPMGGKLRSRGHAEPYGVKYINEYELLQDLLSEVIF